MTGFIILDTNIYRQLGLKFFEHIDCVNLRNFCYASGYEMTINDIVALEYLDFYKKEILENRIEKLKQSIDSLNSIPYFERIKHPRLKTKKEKAIIEFEKRLFDPNFKIKATVIDPIKLTGFLLENKQNKDSTRDYLIWRSIISFAIKRDEDKICLISNDKIFKDNNSLRSGIDRKILDRIEIYDSISEFLFKNGFKVDFLTLDYLAQNINFNKIISELFKRPRDILTYVSIKYWHYKGKVTILHKEIKYQKVDKFYTYIDPEDNKHKFLAHVILKPSITFGISPNYQPDFSKLTENEKSYLDFCLETYDDFGNPVYDKEVLFLIGGVIDTQNNRIFSQSIYDFFLDYYEHGYA